MMKRGAAPPLRPPGQGGGGGRGDPPRPDLVLIDGGAGQLGAAMEVMADLGVDDIAVVGVAKGPDRDAGLERFFMPGKPPFMLEPKSPVLYYLQRLRDEAHRFAIGTHRTAPRHGDDEEPAGRDRGRRAGRGSGPCCTPSARRAASPAPRRRTWPRSRASARRWPSASTTISARPDGRGLWANGRR